MRLLKTGSMPVTVRSPSTTAVRKSGTCAGGLVDHEQPPHDRHCRDSRQCMRTYAWPGTVPESNSRHFVPSRSKGHPPGRPPPAAPHAPASSPAGTCMVAFITAAGDMVHAVRRHARWTCGGKTVKSFSGLGVGPHPHEGAGVHHIRLHAHGFDVPPRRVVAVVLRPQRQHTR